MENQIDEVASIDNDPGSSNGSALLEDDLGRNPKRNMLKRAIEKLRNSNTVKFILFKEDFPKHRIIENLSPLHAIIAFYLSLFIGSFGCIVLAHANFLGFIAYYVIVAVMMLEVLHYLCDR